MKHGISFASFLVLSFVTLGGGAYAAEPTYHGQIIRLMQSKCIQCHHSGGIGNGDWADYATVASSGASIKAYVQLGLMPPWNASPEETQGYGAGQGFLPNSELTQEQIVLIATWVDAGAPEGDPADAPPALVFDDGWFQGPPDVVLEMPVAWTHDPGADRYRCFIVEPQVAGSLDNYEVIIGFEVKPSNLEIAHHAVVYIADGAAALAAQAADTVTPMIPNDGYDCFGGSGISGATVLQGWAPGSNSVALLNDKLGIPLPPDKVIINQMHYHNFGATPETDQTSVGLVLAPDPYDPELLLVINQLPTDFPGISVPAIAGPAATRDGGYGPMWPSETNTYYMSVPIGEDIHLVSVFPHMHLIGDQFNVTATLPGGGPDIPIIDLDKWDFDWQLSYNFKQPIALSAGSTLHVQGTYTNTTLSNVIGGLASNDEMLTLGLSLTTDSEGVPTPRDSTPPQYVQTDEIAGPSSLALLVEFDEDMADPHYPSAFQIVGPGGRVVAPFSLVVAGNTLVVDYDPAYLDPKPTNAWVDLTTPTAVSHDLLLHGFFGIKDIEGNFLDGDGDGTGSEIADDVTHNFMWSGPEFGTVAEPFSTIEGGLAGVQAGGSLRILSEDSSAIVTIDQDVTLVAEGGTVRIGVAGP
ncbi:MAG: hypothetical protein VCD00_13875 [Candidatus Hydrogenedentota bacterium]